MPKATRAEIPQLQAVDSKDAPPYSPCLDPQGRSAPAEPPSPRLPLSDEEGLARLDVLNQSTTTAPPLGDAEGSEPLGAPEAAPTPPPARPQAHPRKRTQSHPDPRERKGSANKMDSGSDQIDRPMRLRFFLNRYAASQCLCENVHLSASTNTTRMIRPIFGSVKHFWSGWAGRSTASGRRHGRATERMN